MSDEKNQSKVKQGAVTAQRLKVNGFRGAFLDARFGDDGVSEGPVSPATAEALQRQFPRAKVSVVEPKTAEGAQQQQ